MSLSDATGHQRLRAIGAREPWTAGATHVASGCSNVRITSNPSEVDAATEALISP